MPIISVTYALDITFKFQVDFDKRWFSFDPYDLLVWLCAFNWFVAFRQHLVYVKFYFSIFLCISPLTPWNTLPCMLWEDWIPKMCAGCSTTIECFGKYSLSNFLNKVSISKLVCKLLTQVNCCIFYIIIHIYIYIFWSSSF